MTIEEAIKHCLEVAEENDLAAGTYGLLAENNHNAYERLTAETNSERCAECAADHRQLAEWLAELKELRETHNAEVSIGGFFEDTNKILVDRIKELEEENEEAKRLLKLAVEDFPDLTDMWRYADKVMKLIGGIKE